LTGFRALIRFFSGQISLQFILQKELNMKTRAICMFLSAAIFAGCASENKNTMAGAGIGAGVGAVVGGIIGHQTGKRNEGALIGAAIGGTIGGVAGHRMDKQAKELEKIAETKRTDQGLVTKLKSDILFDSGKAALKPQAHENLKQMAGIMKKYPENILTVNGYTDNTGSSKVNEELSRKRAEAVRNALVANGMPGDTISVQGLGPAQPVADNKTEDGRKKNRRVEIQVTVDESKIPKDQKTAGN
jgi:outer membrane protein OmpA-like peptidoglycan-associated protein